MERKKEIKKAAKYSNSIVEKNRVKFEKKLTANQKNFLHFLIINEKNGKELNGITWNELQKALLIPSGDKYSMTQKKNFVKELMGVMLSITRDENDVEFMYIFPRMRLKYNKLIYLIEPEVIELFDQPTMNYYLMNFDNIKHFKHDYSIEIYELLNKELDANETEIKDYIYNIDKLKEYLGIEKSEYSDPKNFRVRVLDPSLREISEYSDINIAGTFNQKTKKVQLSSKVWGKNEFFIGGISRKSTTQNYMDAKQLEFAELQEKGRTKVEKVNIKKSKGNYIEPEYEVANTTEVDSLSFEESKALLENPFGENKEVEKSDVEKLLRKVLEAETDIAKIVEDVPEPEFEQMETEEEIVNNDGINNIPTGLFNDAADLYFWFFEGVVSKEQVPNGLKKLEEKHNYTLSKEEKLKLYHEAKETHEGKYPW